MQSICDFYFIQSGVNIRLVATCLNLPTCDVKMLFVRMSSSGGAEKGHYKRNEKLDQKISLYSGDITKLEIDAIVNAGMCVCGCLITGSVCKFGHPTCSRVIFFLTL